MTWLKKWLGITALEKRLSGMEEVINHLIVHLTEARDNIDKLSQMVLTYQIKPEVPVVEITPTPKPKSKPKKKPNGK